jgi:hypothetical protein
MLLLLKECQRLHLPLLRLSRLEQLTNSRLRLEMLLVSQYIRIKYK